MDLLRYIVAHLHPWLNTRIRLDSFSSRVEMGARGEACAALYLERAGCRILRRNFHPPTGRGGEVDLVFRHGQTLVFGEVKTRRSLSYGAPSRAVNRTKRRLIRRGARAWRKALKEEVNYRYDILEVLFLEGQKPEVRWVQNAFGQQEKKGASF